MKNRVVIGCIADDFTGASDAASFLIGQGLKTVLANGIPGSEFNEDCNAIVVALKSRTQKKEDAVKDSLEAMRRLRELGAEHIYFKYCSTFDSTKEGNIGPVSDALIEQTGDKYTILCPALPVNKREVRDGILYVDGVKLSETHMRNHPLTPMWSSCIKELMTPQTKYPVIELNAQELSKSTAEILEMLNEYSRTCVHFYVVTDYYQEAHAKKIAEVFGNNILLTGGSGILSALAKKYRENLEFVEEVQDSETKGRAVIFAGSCSVATLGQIEDYKSKGYASYQIDPIELLEKKITFGDIWNAIENNENMLVYTSNSSENVLKAQERGKEVIAELLESTTAKLAKKAVENGFKRIIVAGGETSSAGVKMLGYDSFMIGKSIAPGVPIMAPLADKTVRVVLKSGNFGQIDFFNRAIKMTGEQHD